ncbi:MAG: zinc-ribbon domain-containing protein [Thermoplasmatota archaeon]
MPVCPSCGKEVEEEAKYCPHCGAGISVDIEKVKIQLDDLKDKQKQGWIALGLGVIFLVVGLFVTLITETHEEWRGGNLYEVVTHPYKEIGIVLMLAAIALTITGGIIGEYYSRKRKKLLESKGLST